MIFLWAERGRRLRRKWRAMGQNGANSRVLPLAALLQNQRKGRADSTVPPYLLIKDWAHLYGGKKPRSKEIHLK